MVCTMQSLGIYFKFSPKRQRLLEYSIKEVEYDTIAKSKFKVLCETRWVERHAAFDDLATLYEPIFLCFEKIELNKDPNKLFDPKSVTEASGILKQ